MANKYHEGNMKRTLKRELKESAIVAESSDWKQRQLIDLAWCRLLRPTSDEFSFWLDVGAICSSGSLECQLTFSA